MEEKNKHYSPDRLYGVAINYTRIDNEGKMWVGNNEYETQVNFCPWTGKPAPTQLVFIKTYESGAKEYK